MSGAKRRPSCLGLNVLRYDVATTGTVNRKQAKAKGDDHLYNGVTFNIS